MKFSSNVVDDSNNENNFSHELLLTNTQVSKLRKPFTHNSSANITSLKTRLYKIGQSGRFSCRLLEPLLKAGLPLRKNVLKSLVKSILIPLGLTAAALATNATIHQKMVGSGTITQH